MLDLIMLIILIIMLLYPRKQEGLRIRLSNSLVTKGV